ncbi:hypothetical protein MXB_2993, partial [Myxobolus squamalis]
ENNSIRKTSIISNVENYALNYYSKNFGYSRGLFAEGAPFVTLYGLFFWDIAFTDVQNAFFSQYQIKPFDLFSSRFYSARKHLIDSRLNILLTSPYQDIFDIIKRNWDENY